jgi:hypothetical protein
MLKNKSNIPNVVSYLGLNLARGSLEKKCGHDVLACSPMEAVKWISTPSFFIIGDKDELVQIDKFKEMFAKCRSHTKKIIVEAGAGHPDSRAEETMEEVFQFFEKNSKIKSVVKKEDNKENSKKVQDEKPIEEVPKEKEPVKTLNQNNNETSLKKEKEVSPKN